MNAYLESSAALRDLLEGESGAEVRETLRKAAQVATSRVTLAEVGRVLARLRVLDPATAVRVAPREAEWLSDSELWFVHPIDEDVLARCSRPFPVEPLRLLDAVHLATVEKLAVALPGLAVVSTDDRVRRNAEALGFPLAP